MSDATGMTSPTANSTPLLSCRGLQVSYQKSHKNHKNQSRPQPPAAQTAAHQPRPRILDSISLDFYPGEFIALLGRNGAGKTTLLSALTGLIPADYDQLEINGQNPQQASRAAIARSVSFVPQEHEEMFPFSVLDVVVMGRTPYLGVFGAPDESDYQQSREVLTELNIEHLADREFPQLSGGEKQLVLLARALVQTRTMIFLDEPTNHLDYKNRYHILSILREQCRTSGSCVVACLHDPNHAHFFADRVIMLEGGRILQQGPTRDVMTAETVSRLYGLAVRALGREAAKSGEGAKGPKRTTAGKPEAAAMFFEPCFSLPECRGTVLLLVGDSGEGKTTTLERLLTTMPQLSFDGIICPGTWKNNRRFSSDAKRIATGEQAPFARRTSPDGNSPFTFFAEGKALADATFQAGQHHNTDCLVIDEIGPLELRGEGYAEHIPALLSLEKTKHIWTVRRSIVSQVCSRWMLVAPVIVDVCDADAVEKIERFLRNNLSDPQAGHRRETNAAKAEQGAMQT